MKDFNEIRDTFISTDGETVVSYRIYEPENPKAVIQLSHGMCEYVARYERHAAEFCRRGFVFCGNDHLGHGDTAVDEKHLGYTGTADFLVGDLKKMNDIIHVKYKGLPVILFGHSMGSFIARCYLSQYGDTVDGAVISGTAGPENPTGIAKLLAKRSAKKHGWFYRDEKIRSLSTGSYRKKLGKDAGKSDWITTVKEVVKAYDEDPLCNYTFTVNGYYNMFELLSRVSRRDWAGSVRRDLPVLMISGYDDPVGNFGKGVMKIYTRLKKAGVGNLKIRLWEGARHELLNESVRIEVIGYVSEWIDGIIGKAETKKTI